MKKIYIVLTYTGTFLSKVIKLYTRKEFSHVSISLDSNLEEMYSFARYNAYNPFWAGFVHEKINSGTFARFKKTKTKVYSLEVSQEQYDKVVKIINDINDNNLETIYRFNFLGIIAAAFNLKLKRERHFYCSEFVKYVLDNSDISLDLPNVVKPSDFMNLDGFNIVYNGFLKDYPTY